ncbi:hypothetical protein N7536_000057 [Penicillium majusculum]|nr:hypothetical protein N7536_000057 [Penicillium majusculum]
MSQHHIIRDDSSSVYSRPIDSPKVSLTSRAASTLPAKHELPEINSLDHQIAMARGSTMALETTRVRLQSSKSEHRRSLPELRSEKLRQLGQQKSENEFYQACLENLHELSNSVIEAIQDLTPQSYFEPDATQFAIYVKDWKSLGFRRQEQSKTGSLNGILVEYGTLLRAGFDPRMARESSFLTLIALPRQ